MKINIIGAIFKHKNNGLFRELSKSAKEFKISMPMCNSWNVIIKWYVKYFNSTFPNVHLNFLLVFPSAHYEMLNECYSRK